MRGLIVALLLTACGSAQKVNPEPDIHTDLHCFVVETPTGSGVVCTEKSSHCELFRGYVERQDHWLVSECREADVTVDAKD